MGNIPLHLTNEELGALFTDAGFRIVSASVAMDTRGKKNKNRGFGWVEFASVEEKDRGVAALDGTMVGTRKIRLSPTL